MGRYDTKFFQDQSRGSYNSAKLILPIIFDLVSPKSIVDVGCGVGTWLAACRELGVMDIAGIDGEYVDRRRLRVPLEYFTPADLTRKIELPRKFDLAICLEVAEHLPISSAHTLVSSLASFSSSVLFSAAIPGQRGVNHINEQWPPYWEKLFADHGYQLVDCIRWRVWDQKEVEFWYAQNCFLFVQRDLLSASPRLLAEQARAKEMPRSIVHPGFLGRFGAESLTPRQLLRLFPGSFKHAVLWRLSRGHPSP
jgi:SAM-dependent methyltransferase